MESLKTESHKRERAIVSKKPIWKGLRQNATIHVMDKQIVLRKKTKLFLAGKKQKLHR